MSKPVLPELGKQQPLKDPESNPQLTVPVQKEKDWHGWYLSYKNHERPIISIHPDGAGVDIGGNPDHPGRLIMRDGNVRATYIVDGEQGASNQLGDLALSTFENENPGGSFQNVHPRIRLSGKDGTITLKTKGISGKETIKLDGNQGDLELGGAGAPGNVVIKDASPQPAITLNGDKGAAFIKSTISVAKLEADSGVALDVNGKSQTTDLAVRQETHTKTLLADVSVAIAKPEPAVGTALDVNGKTQTTNLTVNQETQTKSLQVSESATMAKSKPDPGMTLDVNGTTQTTRLEVKESVHTPILDVDGQTTTSNLTVEQHTRTQSLDVDGQTKTDSLIANGKTQTKSLQVDTTTVMIGANVGVVLDVQGKARTKELEAGNVLAQSLQVNGKASADELASQNLKVTGVSTLGEAAVKTLTIEEVMTILRASQIEVTGSCTVISADGKLKTILDGGDIRLSNADCAEDFDVSEAVEPGTVMVLNDAEGLSQSTTAYDKRVAGIISGAGGYRPGIILDQQEVDNRRRLPVALMGKVYCKVDASPAPIEVGDLLTTSATPGHAMKAADPLQAFGAVIGKALRPLATGKGLIPVLVALQ